MRRIIWAGAIFISLLLLFLLFFRPKPLAVRKELEVKSELHKVKRITGKQVEAAALRLGDSLVAVADSLWQLRLTAALNQDNIKAALAQYPPQNYPEVQAGARHYQATLTRQAQTLPSAADSGQVKVTGNAEILYTRPIFIKDALCLRCHGTVGQEVLPANLAELKKAYPAFHLTGFKTNDQIGHWQIKFLRAPILHQLSLQSRKSLRPR